MIFYSFLAVLLLCFTHVFSHKLNFTNIPRSKFLSVAGGISVAYIFLAAFPELNEIQSDINETEIIGWERIAELEVYILALVGLSFFYGLEKRAKRSKDSNRSHQDKSKKDLKMFWIHISSFGLYNFIIGYLLINREEQSLKSFLLYGVAMAFHFIVTDHGLEDHFSKIYRKKGRWFLVAAVILGWLFSIFFSVPKVYIGILFAFLAGGVIMNVLKEELPEERESNLPAFSAGVLLYSVILILTF